MRELPQLVWLTSFLAVVEHGTFTAAARSTNRAQPRVSAHVASLERHLGAVLLERGPRNVRLTSAGEALLPYARGACQRLRSGVDAVEALASTLQGHIAVGSYPGAMAVLIAPVLHRFREKYPGVQVVLREADPANLEDEIAAGEIDLAVRTSDVPQRHHNVPSIPLFEEAIQLITPRDHPLSGGSIDPLRLRDHSVVVSGEPQQHWTDYRDRLDQIGVEPHEVITVSQPTTVMALVREGFGVGLLGELAARVTASEELECHDLPGRLWRRQIRLYYRASDEPLPAIPSAFLEMLRTQITARGLSELS